MAWSIVASNLWKMLGRRWVLRNVTATIPEGRTALIVGPNGSGKSTFLKIAAGLWRPTKGKIRVLSEDPTHPSVKEKIGVVLHENVLYDELTVGENIKFYSKFYRVDPVFAESVIEVLELKKVWNRRVGELSFGWKRRANIARAVIHKPAILLIDEPLTGLDPLGREAVVEILRMLLSDSRTVVAAAPTLDRILIDSLDPIIFNINNGRLVRVEP